MTILNVYLSFRCKNVSFINLVFQKCTLTSVKARAIIEIDACNSNGVLGSIQLHDVRFVNNKLFGTSGIYASDASCSSLKISEVGFFQNTCQSDRCFAHLASSNNLRNVTISQNKSSGEKDEEFLNALIFMPPESNTEISGLRATQNSATVIQMKEGKMKLSESTISQNKANSAIRMSHSEASITCLTCSHNVASENGACLSMDASTATICDSKLKNNSATVGGAIYSSNSQILVLNNTEISINNAKRSGGAIALSGSKTNAHNCTFSKNKSGNEGGSVYMSDSNANIANCTFNDNRSTNGGSLAAYFSTIVFENTNFEEDHAEHSGGSIFVDNFSLDMDDSNITRSRSGNGGGISSIASNLDLTDVEISSCHAEGNGGALHSVTLGEVTIQNSSFKNNTAKSLGGVLCTFHPSI